MRDRGIPNEVDVALFGHRTADLGGFRQGGIPLTVLKSSDDINVELWLQVRQL